MRVYISGPITGTSDYMDRFAKAEKQLIAAGYDVVNPAKVNDQLPKTLSHSEYMAVSYAMIAICDAVYFMSEWKNSKGCIEEYDAANRSGMVMMWEGGNVE